MILCYGLRCPNAWFWYWHIMPPKQVLRNVPVLDEHQCFYEFFCVQNVKTFQNRSADFSINMLRFLLVCSRFVNFSRSLFERFKHKSKILFLIFPRCSPELLRRFFINYYALVLLDQREPERFLFFFIGKNSANFILQIFYLLSGSSVLFWFSCICSGLYRGYIKPLRFYKICSISY